MSSSIVRSLIVSLVTALALQGAVRGEVLEVEPNDRPEDAQAVPPGETVAGQVQRSDQQDCFRFTSAAGGTVTAEVTGFPADCAFELGATGFGPAGTPEPGWVQGAPCQPVRLTFPVEAGRSGVVRVRLCNQVSGISQGDWTGVACSATGPYHTTPPATGGGAQPPATMEGRPVAPPITYRLSFLSGPIPGATGAVGAADRSPGTYYAISARFLEALFGERFDEARALTTDGFRAAVPQAELVRLRRAVVEAGGAQAIGRSCLAEPRGVLVRVVLRLKNFRKMTIGLVFEGDRIAGVTGR